MLRSTLVFISVLPVVFLIKLLDEPDADMIVTNNIGDAVWLNSENGCSILNKRQHITLLGVGVKPRYTLITDDMEKAIGFCREFRSKQISRSEFYRKIYGTILFPGTKWCSPGNRSGSYRDLGEHSGTDYCCRAHHLCDNMIKGNSCHHEITNLCNDSPYPRFHCDCDENFRKCLQNSTDSAAETIGYAYFNMLASPCFKKEYPILKCQERRGPMLQPDFGKEIIIDYEAKRTYKEESSSGSESSE